MVRSFVRHPLLPPLVLNFTVSSFLSSLVVGATSGESCVAKKDRLGTLVGEMRY
ncbi:16839_t:CDS:2 [Rhizophagus irregularis]|nr:16839_t:CDS:2 [Rhizophagus irregularis]